MGTLPVLFHKAAVRGKESLSVPCLEKYLACGNMLWACQYCYSDHHHRCHHVMMPPCSKTVDRGADPGWAVGRLTLSLFASKAPNHQNEMVTEFRDPVIYSSVCKVSDNTDFTETRIMK